ncbi:flagellar biosynthetic protein FliR [Agaribacterium haliotis]|uniref:flagellar biosynthetic protein FliR n=1 Tax=Agaribacterium haliotis TaxID=2013869 RepID=UPI000BB55E62|nr:flagellar biosynthetic protein FliR [Agaribacterium haliotis]
MISDQEIALFVQQYFLPFVRIASMFMVVPVIGSKLVSPRVRLALASLLSILALPLMPSFEPLPLLSVNILPVALREIAIGTLMGFCFQVVFHVFVLAGQFMAMKMGLGFAMMNDPTNGVQTTVLSQFFLILTTLMFVSVNGHLYLISLLMQSFHTLPVGQSSFAPAKLYMMVELGSWMFASALVFALPVMTSLLFINIAFGVMSRAAPQLNIFAIGFPFTLICGLGLIYVGLGVFIESFELSLNGGFAYVHELIEAP